MSKRRTPTRAALSERVQVAFGNRLKAARKRDADTRFNQEDLASALEVSRTSVSNIERGRHRIFLDQVFVAAKTLGVEVADLIPSMDEVFRDTLSTGQAIRPQAERDTIALVDSLRERALREVREGQPLKEARRMNRSR